MMQIPKFNQTLQQLDNKEANKGSKRPIEDLFSDQELLLSHERKHKRIKRADEDLIPFSGKSKVDKNLKLSNPKFKSVIEESIRLPKTITDKLNILKTSPAYPNTYLFAQLASRVYKEEGADSFVTKGVTKVKGIFRTVKADEKLPELPKGWQLLTTAYNNELDLNGYFGAAYWNPDHQQIVIAHMGTDPSNPGALWADIKGIFLNRYVAQISSAITFADKVVTVLNEINSKNPELLLQLSFTGHSLGGWLAQITTFTTKYLKKKGYDFF